ncbi:MAG: nucleotidyltransferase domain-containing protein [Nanoarchaeota archaeon]|nr:nucleotidyltransferase domain-containing protein [Nanoarchaeota archaeon]
MPTNSNLSSIKNRVKSLISDKEIIEIVVFGSILKGKVSPSDVDLAVILDKKPSQQLLKKINSFNEFHISILTANEFFLNSPSIVHTLVREGYGLKNNKFLAENFKFSNKILYNYSLISFPASMKVKIVNILRGKREEKGIVESNEGKWLANQVFVVPINSEKLFEEFFSRFSIKFTKSYVLIH